MKISHCILQITNKISHLDHTHCIRNLNLMHFQYRAGADPEIEEGGGGHTYKMGVGAARVGRSCLCAR